MCEFCGDGPTCAVCGRGKRPDFKTGSAWETWRNAGLAYAIECRTREIGVVPLGDKAFYYAASRGLPHQDVIRRAFIEGYRAGVAIG